jgi:hypothetical protein
VNIRLRPGLCYQAEAKTNEEHSSVLEVFIVPAPSINTMKRCTKVMRYSGLPCSPQPSALLIFWKGMAGQWFLQEVKLPTKVVGDIAAPRVKAGIYDCDGWRLWRPDCWLYS